MMNPEHAAALIAVNNQAVRALYERRTESLKSVDLHKAVQVALFQKQLGNFVADVAAPLRIAFQKQVTSAADRLKDTSSKNADVLRQTAFNPREHDTDLVDAILPEMARTMGEAAVSQLVLVGVDPRGDAGFKPKVSKNTASEWLDFDGLDSPPGLDDALPVWLVDAIDTQLRNTFSQDFWQGVSDTTAKHIEGAIRRGIEKGLTVQQIAKELKTSLGLGFEYYSNRARAVARTEAGNAINGARDIAISKMAEELAAAGSGVGIVKVWTSALVEETRESHSDLHDSVAQPNGLWELAGVSIPWPAHYSLPVEQRVNCMCTLAHRFVS